MAFRGTESPMDFEWQGHGPVDPTSPFHKHTMAAQAKKRTHSEFDSPKKGPVPALREPNNQPFFFSNLPKSPPQSFRSPSFTTPRKPFDLDFSSGAENSSPMAETDPDDTPDAKPAPVEFKSSPLKPEHKRGSLLGGIYGRFAPTSPGRGEIRKPHSDAIARRIHKKRRRAQKFDRDLLAGRPDQTDDSDDDQDHDHDAGAGAGAGAGAAGGKAPPPPVQEVGWMAGVFTFIHTYPEAPAIIAKYLQVFFNAAILGGCLYLLWSFYATIRADVDRASDDAMAEVLAEMAVCSRNYVENRCSPDTRLPALETVCSNWELCMQRDPSAVKRARLSAHTFAEIFNSFVEPISLKTMGFMIALVVVGLLANNATFTYLRRQQEYQTAHLYRPPSGSYLPPPPSLDVGGQPAQLALSPGLHYGHHPSYMGWPGAPGLGGHAPPQLEYQRSPSKEHRSRSRSPEKKKQFL